MFVKVLRTIDVLCSQKMDEMITGAMVSLHPVPSTSLHFETDFISWTSWIVFENCTSGGANSSGGLLLISDIPAMLRVLHALLMICSLGAAVLTAALQLQPPARVRWCTIRVCIFACTAIHQLHTHRFSPPRRTLLLLYQRNANVCLSYDSADGTWRFLWLVYSLLCTIHSVNIIVMDPRYDRRANCLTFPAVLACKQKFSTHHRYAFHFLGIKTWAANYSCNFLTSTFLSFFFISEMSAICFLACS